MATTKKSTYIDVELDWAEDQIESWKAYVEARPLEELEDIPVGRTYRTVEVQGKFIRDTMKDYLSLLEVVKRLREKEEEKKKEGRGGNEIPHRMKNIANEDQL